MEHEIKCPKGSERTGIVEGLTIYEQLSGFLVIKDIAIGGY